MHSSLVAERSGLDVEAIAAREAEVMGEPQRVPPLPLSALTQEHWDIVNNIRRSIGLPPTDEMAGYALTMIRHPSLFKGQLELGTALFLGKVPPRERELMVLRVAWLLRAPYEWGEHVGIGHRYGVTAEEIERVIEGSQAAGWSEHEAAILRAVEEMLSKQSVSDETWAVLARGWDEEQLLEFPMMVGQYVCTAIVQNTLRIRMEKDNPGLSAR